MPRTPLQVLGPHGCGQPVRAHCEAAVGARGRAGGVQYGTGGCTRGRQLDGGDPAGPRGQGGELPSGACGRPVHGVWALKVWLVPGLWSLCTFNPQSELRSGYCVGVGRQGQPERPLRLMLDAISFHPQISHTFTDYGPGVRFVRFEHGGQDSVYWKGWFGARVTNSSVWVEP